MGTETSSPVDAGDGRHSESCSPADIDLRVVRGRKIGIAVVVVVAYYRLEREQSWDEVFCR